MYGLVNQAIEDLVNEVAGLEMWERIKSDAGITEPSFLAFESYPDKVTYNLVSSASKHLNMEPFEVLRAFGRHWLLFTAEKGYGNLIKSTASNLTDFLDNLDGMHAKVAMTTPGLQLPSFELERINDSTLHLHYHSEREGLAPMVIGLLEGLCEFYEEKNDITHLEELSNDVDHEIFEIKGVL